MVAEREWGGLSRRGRGKGERDACRFQNRGC